jgi:EAL domain-containing protein (putative c-di-GMP-specific phosphodiesterase class I)
MIARTNAWPSAHPVQGLLMPASFMPEVERTELIEPVTRWVLNEALRQQHSWREEGVDLTVAVNISAHEPTACGRAATSPRSSPS